MSAHMDDVTGKASNLARILLVLTALLVSCGGDDATATPNSARCGTVPCPAGQGGGDDVTATPNPAQPEGTQ